MTHYVYKITNTMPINSEQFYIGVHSTDNITPLEDGYMGLSKYLSIAIKNQGIDCFIKTILSTWDTRQLAEKEERRLHHEIDVRNNKQYFNRHNASDKNTIGYNRVVAKDEDKNIVWMTKSEFDATEDYVGINKGCIWAFNKTDNLWCWVSTEEYHNNKHIYNMPTNNKVAAFDTLTQKNIRIDKVEFDKSDRYIGVSSNKVTALNLESNIVEQIDKDLFDTNPSLYVSVSAGKITAFDTHSNKTVYISVERFYSSDRYTTKSTNMVSCIDTNTGITKQVSKKDFDNTQNYVGVNVKHIYIYDKHNNFIKLSNYNFRLFCKNNNYPYTAFYKSYSTKLPVYNNIGSNHNVLEKKDLLKYKGWIVSSTKLY